MPTIATILLIAIAGIFKAVADTLTHHFDTSVFRWKDRKFWDPSISWKYADYLRFTKYKIDAWHLSNSAMLICFCAAIVCALRSHSVAPWWVELLIAGAVFNVVFNVFYNKILRK